MSSFTSNNAKAPCWVPESHTREACKSVARGDGAEWRAAAHSLIGARCDACAIDAHETSSRPSAPSTALHAGIANAVTRKCVPGVLHLGPRRDLIGFLERVP